MQVMQRRGDVLALALPRDDTSDIVGYCRSEVKIVQSIHERVAVMYLEVTDEITRVLAVSLSMHLRILTIEYILYSSDLHNLLM